MKISFLKRTIMLAVIIVCLFFCISYATEELEEYNLLDMTENLMLNAAITLFIYCAFPVILRALKGKYEYEKGKTILLGNSIVGFILFTILKISVGQNSIANIAPAILYYWVNKAILLLPENNIKKEDDPELEKLLKISKKIKCKVCDKEIPYNENETCEECHKKILERLNQKEEIIVEKSNKEDDRKKDESNYRNINLKNKKDIIFCPKCSKEVEQEDVFCCYCGYDLQSVYCTECGCVMKKDWKFCRNCGKKAE